jgi:uncharacterized protein (DUF1778 family)
MPGKKKVADTTPPSPHGGYRTGVEGGKDVMIRMRATASDDDLLRRAAAAAGFDRAAGGLTGWAIPILVAEAQRVLDGKKNT